MLGESAEALQGRGFSEWFVEQNPRSDAETDQQPGTLARLEIMLASLPRT
jgi:hypothetical protein